MGRSKPLTQKRFRINVMARPRNIPIDISQGATKDVTIAFDDKPDLTSAEGYIIVKRHAVDEQNVLCKPFDLERSTKKDTGELVFVFVPSDTINLPPRAYTYEVKVVIGEDVYVPLMGDFSVFSILD